MKIAFSRFTLSLALLLGFTLASAEETIMVKVKDGGANIETADLSDLAVGESQIIYTENGKEITMTRTDDGMEVLVDGEQIDTGDNVLHADCNVEVMVETDCEDCSDELHDMLVVADVDGGANDCGDTIGEEEHVWVSEDGKQRVVKTISVSSNGGLSEVDGEKHIIIIRKEVNSSSDGE